MIDINLFDRAFRHLMTSDGIYSITDNKIPTFIRYNRDNYEWDGITIFTDSFILSDDVDKVNSKYKVGWIIETRETNNSQVFENIGKVIDKFDFIMTYDEELLEQYPEKTEFYPFGGCWVFRENYGIYEKDKQLSMIYSNKTKASGHRLRHDIANRFGGIMDYYGSGANVPFEHKEEVLAPYRFSIVIENYKGENYFSEKILDCMAVGTVPIYWGASNIGNYFDERGIITFNDIDELNTIISNLTEDTYNDKLEYIQNNIDKIKKYDTQEDWIFENILLKRGMIENNLEDELPEYDIKTYADGHVQSYWLKEFFKAGGDDMLSNFNFLDSDSIVFDVGSYDGEYSKEINGKYNSKCYGFEPVKDIYEGSLVNTNKDIKFFNFALGDKNDTMEITLSDNGSSLFLKGDEKESCTVRDIVEVIDELKIQNINLMKMNIEGGEFDILEKMIELKILDRVDNFLLQFHYYGDNPVFRRHKIIDSLSETHEPVFYYPFVWEHWKRKDVV